MTQKNALPPVAVLEILPREEDGDYYATPVNWRHRRKPPRIEVMPDKQHFAGISVGRRVLARVQMLEDGAATARIIRFLDEPRETVIARYEETSKGARLTPTSRKARGSYEIEAIETERRPRAGDLVLALPTSGGRRGAAKARVLKIIGREDEAQAMSLIAIYSHGIPQVFSQEALDEAEAAKPPQLQPGREDLREVPLVTIDGADARDFDDAVFAQETKDGFRILVAIADVAAYVSPDSALDQTAQERGNSVYFTDRVVPMLPEALSNGLCSLIPHEDRACFAVEMQIDRQGDLRDYSFKRGLMRSHARLTYNQLQAAKDGRPDDVTAPLMEKVIAPLYAAYAILSKAREKRQALDLDLPEREVILDDKGHVQDIRLRQRLDSHKLIEEMMILANIATAHCLEEKNLAGLFRIHDRPDAGRLAIMGEFLGRLGYGDTRNKTLDAKAINGFLARARDRVEKPLVNDMVLRAQSQAQYHPRNIGHFGLQLRHYAHFTSPIRRYADLLTHRALIVGLKLALPGEKWYKLLPDKGECQRIAEHLALTERRAMQAEREVNERYAALFLAERVGAQFTARISGVSRFGLFVSLDETGAEGLVPVSRLPDDRYIHKEEDHALVGQRWGRVFRLSAPVTAILREASPISGGLIFDIAEKEGADLPDLPPVRLEEQVRKSHNHQRRGKKAPSRRKTSSKGKGSKGGRRGGK